MSLKVEKKKLIEEILRELERERQTLIQAAIIAREAATHEESQAEDKYDTRGLEASYLAGAQAKRALELEKMLFDLQRLEAADFTKTSEIGVTALVTLQTDDEKISRVFIVPHAAGLTLSDKKGKIQVVTPTSPLGQELLGRAAGDDFEMELGRQKHHYEILDCV